jgi:hypothetical protein
MPLKSAIKLTILHAIDPSNTEPIETVYGLSIELYRNVRLGADSASKVDGQCSNHCVPAK